MSVRGKGGGASLGAGAQAPVVFEDEFIDGLRELWERKLVFNQVLGLKVTAIHPDRASARIAMRPDLIGHFAHNRIHGGVICAGLDSMGGLAVLAAIGARHMDEPPAARLNRFAKLSTIDLRVDFLRPGIGERFELHAEVLRLGSRVASTRMEFRAADGKLLSTGAAAYMLA